MFVKTLHNLPFTPWIAVQQPSDIKLYDLEAIVHTRYEQIIFATW